MGGGGYGYIKKYILIPNLMKTKNLAKQMTTKIILNPEFPTLIVLIKNLTLIKKKKKYSRPVVIITRVC